MRPKFNDLVYKSAAKPAAKKGAAKKEVLWNTPEKIAVKTNYTAKDLEGLHPHERRRIHNKKAPYHGGKRYASGHVRA